MICTCVWNHPAYTGGGGVSLSTLGGVQYTRGYHEYTGGCSVQWGIPWAQRRIPWWVWGISWVHQGCSLHWGFHTNCFPNDLPHIYHNIPPVYPWYPSSVLNTPSVLMISPGVLNIPRCTAQHLMYYTDITQGESQEKLAFLSLRSETLLQN